MSDPGEGIVSELRALRGDVTSLQFRMNKPVFDGLTPLHAAEFNEAARLLDQVLCHLVSVPHSDYFTE